jgi:hypothetical protein
MSDQRERVAAMLVRSGELAGEKPRQLLVVAVLTIALAGCGLPGAAMSVPTMPASLGIRRK